MGKNKKRGKGNDKSQESTRLESQAEPHTEETTEIDAHQCAIVEAATKVETEAVQAPAESATNVESEAVREPEEAPTKMTHTEEPIKMDTEAATKVETEAVLVSLPFCRFAGICGASTGEAETMATCTTDTPPGSPHVPSSETPLSKPSPTASPSWPTPHPSFHRDEARTPPGSPRAVLSDRGPRQRTFASPKQSEDAVRACIRPTIFSAHCSCIFVIR